MRKGIATFCLLALALGAWAGPGIHRRQDEPKLVVASDLLGNYIGILTDTQGKAPTPNQKITFSGIGPTGPWAMDATSDENGMFSAPMHIGQRTPVEVSSS